MSSCITEKGEQLAFKNIQNNPIILKLQNNEGSEVNLNHIEEESDIMSYYDVILESNDKSFCRKLGSTNTECCTTVPVYGTNLNADLVTKRNVEYEKRGSCRLVDDPIQYEVKRSRVEFNLANDVTIVGKNTKICSYMPFYENMNVRLKLFVKTESAAEWSYLGHVNIPLGESLKTWKKTQRDTTLNYEEELWLPVDIGAEEICDTRFKGEAKVLVKLALQVPADTFHGTHAPYMYSAINQNDASLEGVGSGYGGASETNKMLSSCYHWSRVCGEEFSDPLLLSKENLEQIHVQVPQQETPTAFNGILGSLFSKDTKQDDVVWRLDLPHTIDWLKDHTELLKDRVLAIETLLKECERRVEENDAFRPSAAKKDVHLQAIPINLHGQVLLTSEIEQNINGNLS